MPEAAINEDGDPFPRKHEIRLAENANVSTPAGNSMLPKQRDHSELRVAISTRTNTRHHL